VNDWVIQSLQGALEKWNGALTEILSLISQSPKDFRGGKIWEIISGVNGALQATGLALLVLFFLMGIFKSASNLAETKRPEAAFKLFIRFVLAKAAITYCMELLLALFDISQGIVGSVTDSLGAAQAATLPAEIVTEVAKTGFFEGLLLAIVALLGTLVIAVLSFGMLLTVYGRFFRLFMLTAVAPVPLAAFAGESTANFGKSFLKTYASVCLEGVIVVLACAIFSAFASTPPPVDPSASAMQMVWDYMLQTAFNFLILVGTIKGAERLTKEILGT